MSRWVLRPDSPEQKTGGTVFSAHDVLLVLWLFSGELSPDYAVQHRRELLFSQAVVPKGFAKTAFLRNRGQSWRSFLFQIF